MAKSTTVSNKPWSDFKSSDYSLEQWYKACLVHVGSGVPTSKADCKLPVREPDGTLNRNGVHAAAAALAGARGGVDLSAAEKSSAASSLISLYAQLGEDAPESLKMLAHSDVYDFLSSFGVGGGSPSDVDVYLAHWGVRGMKWGVRRDPSGTHAGGSGEGYSKRQEKKIPAGSIRESTGANGKKVLLQKQNDGTWKETYFSEDQRRLMKAESKAPHELSTAELRAVTERKRVLDDYNKLFNPTPQQKSELQAKVEHLELQKRYRDLQKQMTPQKVSHVKQFVGHVQKGFAAFKAVDKVLGNQLSKGITRRLGLEPALTPVQQLKARNEFLNAHVKNVQLTSQLITLGDAHSRIIDAPSLASKPFRKSAGRHRKHTGSPLYITPQSGGGLHV